MDIEIRPEIKTVPVSESAGMALCHDITEIRPGEFKGRAFKKGHVIREDDIEKLRRLGKEHVYVLSISKDEMHEDDAACALAHSLIGSGVEVGGEPREGKIDLVAGRNGLLKVDKNALLQFNMLGQVMCATLHTNTVVRKGQKVGGTKAIPLVIRKDIIAEAVRIAGQSRENGRSGVLEVKDIRRPNVGVVITGNEVYYGRIEASFAPVIIKKIETFRGSIAGVCFAPDDAQHIRLRIGELLGNGADLLIITGGMSVDPDDMTRSAISRLGTDEMFYGAAALPGSMFLIAYLSASRHRSPVPILGVPACAIHNRTTALDLLLSRILAGEHIGRKDLAEMGHGGLCMNCEACRWPVCPFGK